MLHEIRGITMAETKFALPGKVDSYLATLSRMYARSGDKLLQNVVVNGIVTIQEEWDYDNWNGGTYGHAITLTIPENLYSDAIEIKDEVEKRINEDLNKLNHESNEHFSAVFVEMEPEENDHWRENSGVLRPRLLPASIPAEAMQRIWGPQHVRVFLSHKSSVKEQTSKLKQSFVRCGISAFVAHDDIEPTEEWQLEIERALFSMDALAALLTEDYHDSNWTDQEVGVAIGRGVPLIAVRLGRDPYGLMGKGQGLGGCNWNKTSDIATRVFKLLYKRMPDKSRLFQCALSAYSNSESFVDSAWKVKYLLSIFDNLSSDQVDNLMIAYRNNSQNKSSFDGMNLLKPLLKKWTGNTWTVVNNELVQPGATTGHDEISDIPF